MSQSSRVHRIRLVAAWQRTLVDAEGSTENDVRQTGRDGTKVHLPDQVNSPKAIYRRRFNQPTHLGPNQSVRLCIDSCVGELTQVELNSKIFEPLPAFPIAIEITGELESFNLLTLTVRCTDDLVGLDGSIRLEIAD